MGDGTSTQAHKLCGLLSGRRGLYGFRCRGSRRRLPRGVGWLGVGVEVGDQLLPQLLKIRAPLLAAHAVAPAHVELLQVVLTLRLRFRLAVAGEGDVASEQLERRFPVLVILDDLRLAVLDDLRGGGAQFAVGEELAEALL